MQMFTHREGAFAGADVGATAKPKPVASLTELVKRFCRAGATLRYVECTITGQACAMAVHGWPGLSFAPAFQLGPLIAVKACLFFGRDVREFDTSFTQPNPMGIFLGRDLGRPALASEISARPGAARATACAWPWSRG